ncbi:conserved hypothetical protein ['Nostoc azollae' 0708]|uniref:Uncharacterized protein n=1 Tax=Nostoc azollae (strain 0708) TaxID=551115 RepID=D7E114_NOSA0|nr:conserved hypothetical protein ['Nostoc azollae' 0708]
MIKYLVILLSLIFSLSFTSPAFALVCHNYDGYEVCILNIKRSAKKYREHRAAITVDGVKESTCRSSQFSY